MIRAMRAAEPPLLARTAPVKVNVVACAIALRRGELFASDRKALLLFGAHPDSNVRTLWVDGKLAEFAAAGLELPLTGIR